MPGFELGPPESKPKVLIGSGLLEVGMSDSATSVVYRLVVDDDEFSLAKASPALRKLQRFGNIGLRTFVHMFKHVV
ncbi:jg13603 [Pararge aegeria aegeria]|uniref:Jg13603 protein n=1 Tax=Pararge aegeria aegeria TaxID=348720 RepID=A0A8S4QU93_9NEOP|nr:jg13603 [Pararge aegeria aegeria]